LILFSKPQAALVVWACLTAWAPSYALAAGAALAPGASIPGAATAIAGSAGSTKAPPRSVAAAASAPLSDDVFVVAARTLPEGSVETWQVRDAFLGNPVRSASGTLLRAIDRKPAPGESREKFLRAVIGMSPAQLKAYWSERIFTGRGFPPRSVEDAEALKRELAAEPGSISFMAASEYDRSLKVILKIEGK
jgi:hypothetical protein